MTMVKKLAHFHGGRQKNAWNVDKGLPPYLNVVWVFCASGYFSGCCREYGVSCCLVLIILSDA